MEPRDYFRIESEELIGRLTAGLRELGSAAPERAETIWRELGRAAHTLKGAAHVVREKEIAHTAHVLEDALSARDISASQRVVDQIAGALDSGAQTPASESTQEIAAAHVQPLQVNAPKTEDARSPAVETVRVELRGTDELLRVLSECVVLLNCVRASADALGKERESLAEAVRHVRRGAALRAEEAIEEVEMRTRRIEMDLGDCWTRLRRQLGDADRIAHTFRLAPAGEMLLRVDRVARRAAEELKIEIDCSIVGGDEKVDLHLLAAAEVALSHIARNAVVHGLSKKQGQRLLRLGVRRDESTLVFFAEDNGIGIDAEQVRQQARENGWMQPEEARRATSQQLLDLLARPGVSTRTGVSTLAGRGIGLDVARTRIRQLGGDITIQSKAGAGTTISLRVPETLLALPCLVVETGGNEFAIPLSAVIQTHKLSGHRTNMPYRSTHIEGLTMLDSGPLLALQHRGEGDTVIETESPSGPVGLLVNRVVRLDSLVIQPAPAEWQLSDWIMGTYGDESGYARLVLDPARLGARAVEISLHTDAEPLELPPVLVIDDSLTSRTLEASILSSAGYDVDTAISAEQGLEKARRKHYGLFFVDVEMHGMDGFDFVRITREDPVLSSTPVVMVTSRNMPGDRERGMGLGASEYIIKGDFDQGKLLETAAALLRGKQKAGR